MELDKFTLYSPIPIMIQGVGHIKPPKIIDIWEIGYENYQSFLCLLFLNPETYYTKFREDKKEWYESLSYEEKNKIKVFDIICKDTNIQIELSKVLSWFFEESVLFNPEVNKFLVVSDDAKELIGIIDENNFDDVVDIILQFNCVSKKDKEESKPKFKNEASRKLWERMQKIKKDSGAKDSEENLSIGNMVSSVVARNLAGITPINVGNVTVYQLYDIFKKTPTNDVYTMSTLHASVWGGDEWESDGWYKNN